MKRIYLTTISLLSFSLLFSQNQDNMIAPTGRIGIGTLTPTAELEVAGDVKFTNMGDVSLLANELRFLAITKEGRIVPGGLITDFVGAEPGGMGGTTSPCVGPNINWKVDANNNVFLCPDDNYEVGIGTLTPTAPLHVNGLIYSQTGGYKFPDNTIQTTAAQNQNLSLTGNSLSISNGNSVTLSSIPSSPVWTVDGASVYYNGAVGIGAKFNSGTLPSSVYALEVDGLLKTSELHADAVQGDEIVAQSNFESLGTFYSVGFATLNNGFTSNQNSTVNGDLNVTGSIQADEALISGNLEVGNWLLIPGEGIEFSDGSTLTSASVLTGYWNNVSGAGTIFSDNKVAIGTDWITTGANADFKLSVDGKIVAKDVVVTLNDWPDYVFKDGYSLMNLKDVKQYVDQNNHLPNVPSEQQVYEDGVSLKDMNKILLEKVEELTLYLIEQNEKLEHQSEQIQKQNERIESLELTIERTK